MNLILFFHNNNNNTTDADTAKRVTFHKNVRLRSVTLDGDVYDPSGSLSGGSRASTSSILTRIQQLKKVKFELVSARQHLETISAALSVVEKNDVLRASVAEKMELIEYEIGLKTQQLEANSNGQVK